MKFILSYFRVVVRLGEWDLDTTEDCTTTRCFVDYQDDYPIEKIIVHEGYSSNRLSNKVHDIALIKLNGTVEETHLVAPICIPTREMVNSLNVLGKSFDVSGWGMTENGNKSNPLSTTVFSITFLPSRIFKSPKNESDPTRSRYGHVQCGVCCGKCFLHGRSALCRRSIWERLMQGRLWWTIDGTFGRPLALGGNR